MGALEVLRTEHALIRQYLDNLYLALEKLQRGESPPREFFEKAVDFSRGFVDKHHHFKEEHLMFTWLAGRKKGEFDGPIDTLRYQHERSRSHVAMISEALDGYAAGREDRVSDVIENLGAYIAMLRQHIHREDHVFYPLVREELSLSNDKDLLDAFNKENQKAGDRFPEESRSLVESMGALLV